MKITKYLIFLIFNHYYKDGNCKGEDSPYSTTAGIIMLYEIFVVYAGIDFIGNYINISLFTDLLNSAKGIVYGRGMVMCALMYPLNYYYFVKKKHLERIYNEYTEAPINTRMNRIIGCTCLILYWPIMMGLIAFYKS